MNTEVIVTVIFQSNVFFLCIGFSLERDLNLGITIVDPLHSKVGTYYATSCINTSQQQITFYAVEFLQEFCSPDKSHKINSVSICESCCNMLPLWCISATCHPVCADHNSHPHYISSITGQFQKITILYHGPLFKFQGQWGTLWTGNWKAWGDTLYLWLEFQSHGGF